MENDMMDLEIEYTKPEIDMAE